MSLFKILRGDSSRLTSQPFHDGYAYFTPDDGGFYIDAMVDDEEKRIQINKQSDASDPLASGTSIQFIDTISQTDGKISATKKTIRAASTSQTGIVQLNDTVTSASTTQAATANAVKTVQDNLDTHAGSNTIHVTSSEKATWNGKQDALTAGSNITIKNNVISATGGGGGGGASLVSTTYSGLKALRDAGELVEGTKYRITDYETIITDSFDIYFLLLGQGMDEATAQAMRSMTYGAVANHPFDIIVTAVSDNELNENAWAIQHDGDTYFANNDLNAWRLKYTIDNDMSRIEWANGDYIEADLSATGELGTADYCYRECGKSFDINGTTYYPWKIFGDIKVYTTSETPSANDAVIMDVGGGTYAPVGTVTAFHAGTGKGVIFEMEDEFNNKVGYDFKNIKFLRFGLISEDENFTDLAYDANDQPNRYGDVINYFMSMLGTEVYGGKYSIDSTNVGFYYTFDWFDGSSNTDMSLGNSSLFQCRNNTIASMGSLLDLDLDNNLMGIVPYGINGTVWESSSIYARDSSYVVKVNDNVIGSNSGFNTFGHHCSYNTFGGNCYSNTLGNRCTNNSFKDNCFSNTFGDRCYDNTFDNNCSAIDIGSIEESYGIKDKNGNLIIYWYEDLLTKVGIYRENAEWIPIPETPNAESSSF